MNAAAILSRLQASGLHLRAEGGNLHISPKEAVTPETLDLIREHKAELLKELFFRWIDSDHLEEGIRRMGRKWGYSPEDLSKLIDKAKQDPAGSWSLIVFDSDPSNYPGRLQ
jgi:hypothetical protein